MQMRPTVLPGCNTLFTLTGKRTPDWFEQAVTGQTFKAALALGRQCGRNTARRRFRPCVIPERDQARRVPALPNGAVSESSAYA